jgi:hypothetical protein
LTGIAGANNGDQFRCIALNDLGAVVSIVAVLTVPVPVIVNPPLDQTVNVGSSAGFSVTATSDTAMTYQWRLDGVAMSGATAASLVIASVQAGDAGSYPVEVTNANGTVVSAPATLNVVPRFDSWMQSKFTATELTDPTKSGPSAIYGHDGLPNLVKYALGLDPKVDATGSAVPAPSSTSTDWVYTYTRPTNITDVTYAVEVSTDLVTWTPAGVTLSLQSSAGGFDTWVATYPKAQASNVCFRLVVTQ